jgi:site-specific DNA recombinase
MEDTLRVRAQKLQARRNDTLSAMAKLKDQQQLASAKVDPSRIDAFCKALKDRLTDTSSGLGKAYLGLVVEKIRLEGNKLTLRGGYDQLAEAVGFTNKMRLGEVPSLIPAWRARSDSNARPLGS